MRQSVRTVTLSTTMSVLMVVAAACGGGSGADTSTTSVAATSGPSATTDALTTATTVNGIVTPDSVPAVMATTEPSTIEGATTEPSRTEPSSTVEAGGTEASAATSAPVANSTSYVDQWTQVAGTEDCMCGDGSEWSYFVRKADPAKVLFFTAGGGACFTLDTCRPQSGQYTTKVGFPNGFDLADGIFNLDDPRNPFADYSMVYVPYCTGDVHAGNLTKDYGDGVVVEHKGFVNAKTALDGLVAEFPNATSITVAGESAGAFPTPIFGGMLADQLPNATVEVVADGSGAIPDAMGALSVNWGLLDAVPQWPSIEGATYADVTSAWVFEVTAEHDPEIVYARHDYAFDAVLAAYAMVAGLFPDDMVSVMNENEAKIEAAGATVSTWIAPGANHTVLTKPRFYTEQLNGIAFVDWLTSFVDGTPPGDDHCTQCR